MLRNKFTTLIAAAGLTFTLTTACDNGDDDGDTGASTGGGTSDTAETNETNETNPTKGTDTADTADTKSTDTAVTDTAETTDASATAETTDASDTAMESSSTGEPDPCDGVMCMTGETCVAGLCVAGDACPDGEMCQMTGAGTMACLGEPSHCVLACDGATANCPESMSCQAGACQYDVSMGLPTEGLDGVYTIGMTCPAGYFMMPVAFAMGYGVCAPECDGMGQAAACPAAESGTAVGACVFNPTSSGMPC